MALLNILQYPHPTLAAKAAPVTEFNDDLKTLAADMLETMYARPASDSRPIRSMCCAASSCST